MIQGPLLAVLVSLAVPAAADGDAAFAAALDGFVKSAAPIFAQQKELPKGKAAAKPAKPAAPAPLAADEKAWQKLIEAVKKDGKFKPGQLIMPATFTLEESTGDVKGDHVVRIVSFIGGINDDDEFEAEGAMLMSKTYTVAADGSTTIEHWGIGTDVYGEVQDAGHGTMLQDKNGKIVSKDLDKTLTPTDPRVKAQLDAIVGRWAK